MLIDQNVNSSVNVANLLSLTFGGTESACDHVMVDLLSSALKTLQQAQLLAGVFPTKVNHMIMNVARMI